MPVLFGLPVVSILLFIFAGVLIGHLIWYHDLGTDDGKILELEEKYAKASGSAKTNKHEFLQLKQDLDRQGSDLVQIRLSNEELEQKYKKAQGAAEQAGAELERLRREHEAVLRAKQDAEKLNSRNTEVAREAGDELSRQRKLIDELQVANKHYANEVTSLQATLKQKSSVGDDAARQEKLIAELQENVETHLRSRQQMQVALDAAHRELQSHAERNDNLQKELAASVDHGKSLATRTTQLKEELQAAAKLRAERDERAPEIRIGLQFRHPIAAATDGSLDQGRSCGVRESIAASGNRTKDRAQRPTGTTGPRSCSPASRFATGPHVT